ncbi:MAG: MarR family transcriptional regulator [Cytophagaceae bacterium]|nr:MarR family transcriptional regulator [Cytophagaceae bacterium]|tara:strand:- start:4156 stop:4674 length:519 start_codon:yes stop_codon:yes gene_type:complete
MSEKQYIPRLEDQVCFPFYAISKLLSKVYMPHLKKIDLTYTQYLVMMVLWEKDNIKVNEIGERIFLESNTLTPLINKLIKKEYITKKRSENDERVVLIKLTQRGDELKNIAHCVPFGINESLQVTPGEAAELRSLLWAFFDRIVKGNNLKIKNHNAKPLTPEEPNTNQGPKS